MNTLFVAAVAAELGDLPGIALGVGPIVAATSLATTLATLLAQNRPGRVILIGTAGTFPGGPPVGSVVCAAALGMGDPAATLGLGYVPLPPPVLPGLALGDLVTARVLTRLGVTTDLSLAGKLAGEGWAVEHMEAYAAAWACHVAGVPFGAILGIANEVGPDAHRQWRENRGKVEAAAREAARSVEISEAQ